MKNKKLLPAIMAGLVVVVIGVMIFLTREPTPAPSTSSALEPEPAESPATTLHAVATPPAMARTPIGKPVAAATTSAVPSVLATVNGVQITAKDLGPGGGEATQALLDRAIERELILQAANAQGLTLTAEQEQSLADVRGDLANSAAYKAANDPETRDRMQAEVDFRVRDTTAQFLLSALVLPPKDAAGEALFAQEQRLRPYLDGLRAAARVETASGAR